MELNKSNNEYGDLVITGIDSFKILLANSGHFKFTFDPHDNGKFYTIKNVNDEGIETESSNFFPWEDVFFSKEGLMVLYGKNDDNYFYFNLTEQEKIAHPYSQHLEKMADLGDKFKDYEDSLMENKKPMNLKNYINGEVSKLHKKTMLESQLTQVNNELKIINEGEENAQNTYESNVYESYAKDLEEVVRNLAEACNKLESAALRQESHMKTLPEVNSRMDEGRKSKEVILEIFKEVKRAKIAAERKLYELR